MGRSWSLSVPELNSDFPFSGIKAHFHVVYGLGANAPGDVKNTEAMTAAYELGKTV